MEKEVCRAVVNKYLLEELSVQLAFHCLSPDSLNTCWENLSSSCWAVLSSRVDPLSGHLILIEISVLLILYKD